MRRPPPVPRPALTGRNVTPRPTCGVWAGRWTEVCGRGRGQWSIAVGASWPRLRGASSVLLPRLAWGFRAVSAVAGLSSCAVSTAVTLPSPPKADSGAPAQAALGGHHTPCTQASRRGLREQGWRGLCGVLLAVRAREHPGFVTDCPLRSLDLAFGAVCRAFPRAGKVSAAQGRWPRCPCPRLGGVWTCVLRRSVRFTVRRHLWGTAPDLSESPVKRGWGRFVSVLPFFLYGRGGNAAAGRPKRGGG